MSRLDDISAQLLLGRTKNVQSLIQAALDEGINPAEIMDNGLLAGMNVVSEKFKNGEAYVPEVMIAARAMNAGMEVLKPALATADAKAPGKVVLGTVKGDLHDVGKNIVRIMLEAKGIEVVDLGVDVPAERFVQTAIDQGAAVIGCSALLTTTMPVMRDVVECAVQKGVRDSVRIMIGGAPVTQEFCQTIGADAYTPDAATAADVALAFLTD